MKIQPTIPSLLDSRGGKSKTLFFVTVAFVVVVGKFLLGGLAIPHLGTVPVMSAGEFAGAIFGTMLPWVAREWKDKEICAAHGGPLAPGGGG